MKSNSYMDLPMYDFWPSGINYKPVLQATISMVADAAALYGKSITEEHGYGKGKVFSVTDIQSVCHVVGLKPAFSSFKDDSHNLLHITKKVDDVNILYVVNQEDKPVDRICSFRGSGKYPEIWDPAIKYFAGIADYKITFNLPG